MTQVPNKNTKGNILFVENHADTRALISYLLEGAGYHITSCDTLQKGVALASAQTFDLFLLNHVLPDGSGITLCHLLRQAHPLIPIIMFSAAAHPAEQQAGLEAGADEYLVKPHDLLDLPLVIKRLIEAARSHPDSGLSRMVAAWSQEGPVDNSVHFMQATRQFIELFHGLPVACFIVDKEGHIIEWNRASDLLYGWRTTGVSGKSVAEAIHCRTEAESAQNPEENLIAQLMAQVLNGIVIEGQEISIERPDGQLRDILCNAFPLHSPQGEILGGINASMDITRHKRQEEHLKQLNHRLLGLALTDGLTGLQNHRSFKERLPEEFARSKRYDTPLSLILVDIDHFKRYNDNFGHPAGDDLLKGISLLLQEVARDSDIVARYGGEEFAIVLPHTDEEASIMFAERLRLTIEETEWPHQPITASLGIATVTPDIQTASDLVEAADRALYASKTRGRNYATHGRDI